jgi:hypothetical protein
MNIVGILIAYTSIWTVLVLLPSSIKWRRGDKGAAVTLAFWGGWPCFAAAYAIVEWGWPYFLSR